MKTINILRISGDTIFTHSCEGNTVARTLEVADLAGADLAGANLAGADLEGEILISPPLQLNNLRWPVLITDGYMVIGCQRHSHREWGAFTDMEIARMSFYALRFWRESKDALMALCKMHANLKG